MSWSALLQCMGNAMKREEAVCALLMSDDPTDIDEITIVDDAGNPIDNEAKMEYVESLRESFDKAEKAWAESAESVTIKITDE